MTSDQSQSGQTVEKSDWKDLVLKFQTPSAGKASWQLVNTLVPYAALWVLMYEAMKLNYWYLTVPPLAVLAGGFLVRVFIIFHDCGHGSFFRSKKANDITGFITGMLTLTPYQHWKWQHSVHHATSGHLDRRGMGDVWTMTVQEYLEASRWKRFSYRLARNPFVLFVLAPIFLFLVWQRFPVKEASARERASVYWMNLALAAMATVMSLIFGFKVYVILQLIVMAVAGSAGVWMFYVQHQFEDTYWEGGEKWDYTAAALQGSSFYKLPKILQWFSGNIGFHHIHHLSPRIPNYNLERCHRSSPLFHNVKPVTLISSLKSFNLRLWDEREKKLVGYRHIRHLPRGRKRFENA